MSEFAFTFGAYEDLLTSLEDQDRRFRAYDRSIESGDVLLRHDVDYSPRKAARMAEIEAERDVVATYFFLLTSPFYNALHRDVREAIEHIASLGHEVGLHFNTHNYWDEEPSEATLRERVDDEFDVLDGLVEHCSVLSFHNPPEWVLRRAFDGFTSAYEPRFFDAIAYRADSNQRWRGDPPFDDGIPDPVQLLVHPVHWGDRDAFATDRLREERDYLFRSIDEFLRSNEEPTWRGQYGVDESMFDQ